MEYTRIDAGAQEQALRKQKALEAERDAYALELEVVRLDKMPGEAASQAKGDASERAKDRRKAADTLKKFAGITAAETAKFRKEFREQWATALEGEHLSHAVALEAHQQVHTDCDPECSERKGHEEALAVIEAAHKIATKEE